MATLDLETINLSKGSHSNPERGYCAMEAASVLAGDPFSDHPLSVCPVIASFMRAWNDTLDSDEKRNRILRPLLPRVIGTRKPSVEAQRSYMALDWMIRAFTSAWLNLIPSLKLHAATLQSLPFIVDMSSGRQAGEVVVRAAKDAAAARAAARDAARDALSPTVHFLQDSACDLVHGMIAL